MQLTTTDLQALNSLYCQMKGATDFTIYAVGGKEGDRFTWIGRVTYDVLCEQYQSVPETAELPNNLKLQRDLVTSRSRNVRDYLLENRDFIFPEVISISEDIEAELVPQTQNVYKVTIPAQAFRYLVDGQGRRGGIELALNIDSSLGKNTIDIKFVKSEGHERDKQIFADINQTPIAPNKSQCAAMDSRLVVNQFTKDIITSIPALRNRIDYTKASVTKSSKSDCLWTLNQMLSFVQIITGTTAKSCQKLLVDEQTKKYWLGFIEKFFAVAQQHPSIRAALSGELTAQSVRSTSIVGTSVFLKSLAMTGKVVAMHLINQTPAGQCADWTIMDAFPQLDLSISNTEWIGRCLNHRGGYEDKSFNHKAMASYFLIEMGLEVPEDLETIEEEVLLNRAGIKKSQREAAKKLKQEQEAAVDEG